MMGQWLVKRACLQDGVLICGTGHEVPAVLPHQHGDHDLHVHPPVSRAQASGAVQPAQKGSEGDLLQCMPASNSMQRSIHCTEANTGRARTLMVLFGEQPQQRRLATALGSDLRRRQAEPRKVRVPAGLRPDKPQHDLTQEDDLPASGIRTPVASAPPVHRLQMIGNVWHQLPAAPLPQLPGK